VNDWASIWSQVRTAVLQNRTRGAALAAVSQIRGCPTTWDALARAWRRQGDENGGAHNMLGRDNHRISIDTSDPETKAVWETAVRAKAEVDSWPAWKRGESPPAGRKHLVIPDTQVRPGVPIKHARWIGRYIADKGPDVVVHLGDHWDMPSLSSYDSLAKKVSRGVAKKADIDAGNQWLEDLEDELVKADFQPKVKVLLEGNHDGFADEGRIGRFLADNPMDKGLITKDMFADSWTGWTRHDFLDPVEIDGIHYCHLFPFSRNGRVTPNALRMGASSAQVQVAAMMSSCTAGHKQGLDSAIHNAPMAPHSYRGIIAGSCYLHDEAYMGPGNRHYRGILVKHDVRPTNPNHYDLMEVSLEFLRRKYS
jgi:hypothetical protein